MVDQQNVDQQQFIHFQQTTTILGGATTIIYNNNNKITLFAARGWGSRYEYMFIC